MPEAAYLPLISDTRIQKASLMQKSKDDYRIVVILRMHYTTTYYN